MTNSNSYFEELEPIFLPTKMSIYIEEEKTKKKRRDVILKVGKNQQFAVRKEGCLKKFLLNWSPKIWQKIWLTQTLHCNVSATNLSDVGHSNIWILREVLKFFFNFCIFIIFSLSRIFNMLRIVNWWLATIILSHSNAKPSYC